MAQDSSVCTVVIDVQLLIIDTQIEVTDTQLWTFIYAHAQTFIETRLHNFTDDLFQTLLTHSYSLQLETFTDTQLWTLFMPS